MNEPDQIDMMSEDELRSELRNVLVEVSRVRGILWSVREGCKANGYWHLPSMDAADDLLDADSTHRSNRQVPVTEALSATTEETKKQVSKNGNTLNMETENNTRSESDSRRQLAGPVCSACRHCGGQGWYVLQSGPQGEVPEQTQWCECCGGTGTMTEEENNIYDERRPE